MAAGLGDDVTIDVLWHTAATWLMQTGIDMLEASKFLGTTTRTLEETMPISVRTSYLAPRPPSTTIVLINLPANGWPTITVNQRRTKRDRQS